MSYHDEPPPQVCATVIVSEEALRDGSTDVTPIVFCNLHAKLMRELDSTGMELAGPVTFHKGVRDSLVRGYVFRAEAPARPYGSRNRDPAPGLLGIQDRVNRAYATEGGSHLAGIPAPPLKGSPYQVVGGGWVQCVENQGVVPCPPPNSYSIGVESSPYGSVSISSSIGQPIVKTKKENPVGENGYASSYTSSVTQTRAGYVGQVRVEVDGENVIVWESAPFNEAKTAKSRQKAAAAAKVALRKGVDAVFASVTVTDDEVTALLPVEKSAA